jgi:uncharacterized protein (DUF111 family)
LLGHALERLLEAGALDVTIAPLLMKKGRPGSLLSVISAPQDRERLAQLVFAETTTLGLRIYTAERRVETRRLVEVETPHGEVRSKLPIPATRPKSQTAGSSLSRAASR